MNSLHHCETGTDVKKPASSGQHTGMRAFNDHVVDSANKGTSIKLSASLFGNIVPARREPTPADQTLAAHVAPGQTVETVDLGFVRVLQKNTSPAGVLLIVQARKQRKRLSLWQFADLGFVTSAIHRIATLARSIMADGMSIDGIVKEAIRDAGYPVDDSMNWSGYLNKMYAPLLATIPGISKDRIEEAIEHTVMHELWENQILVTNFDPFHRAYGIDKPIENRVSAYLTVVFGGRKEATVLWAEKQLGISRNYDRSDVESGFQPRTHRIRPISMDTPIKDGTGDGTMTIGDTIAGRYTVHEELEQKEDLAHLFASLREYIRNPKLKLAPNTVRILDYMCHRFQAGADKKDVKRELIGNPSFKDRFGASLKDNSYSYCLATWIALLRDMITDQDGDWYGTPIARNILKATSKRRNRDKKEKEKSRAAGLVLAAAMVEEEQLVAPFT